MWGTSGIFVKLLSPFGVSSGVLTLFRGLAGLCFLSVFLLFKDRSLFRISKREHLLYFFLGVTMFGASAFYYAAIQQTSIATAAGSYAAYTILAKVAMDRQYRPLTTTYYSFLFMVMFALPIPSQFPLRWERCRGGE